jgi:transposase
MCPIAQSDGYDAPGLLDELVPGVTAVVGDLVLGVEDAVGEAVVADELPDVFDRVQFGTFGGQRHQCDVRRRHQAVREVPSCLVEQQHGMRAGRHGGGHLGEMQVHRCDVAARKHQGCGLAEAGTDRPEDVAGSGALVLWRRWSGAAACPTAGDRVLLADPGLIGEPDGVDGPCGISSATVRVVRTGRREPPTMSVTMIGLDTAKSVFQIHGVNEAGKAEIKRKLRRSELIPFFEKQSACTVVMEACGAGHHWGRMLTGLGHTVRLIAPETVKPFVKKGKKNDATDAAAICEAASRPEVKFVPVKNTEQQGILALHTARSLLIRQKTMLGNAIRGLATEFGLTVSKGIEKLDELVALVGADESIPTDARFAIAALHDYCNDLVEGIEIFQAKIVAHARHDEIARRVATIPGIGPITASLIAASVVDIGLFKTARQFAAWLGLIPRQSSTGGKTRLGRITKAGNREIRTLLVLGATSMVHRAEGWNSAVGAWLRKILERRPARLVTVALANKMARIAWAVMTRKEVYHPKGAITAVA